MGEARHPGSKRTRKYHRAQPHLCRCWLCRSSKEKLHSTARTTVEREALEAEIRASVSTNEGGEEK